MNQISKIFMMLMIFKLFNHRSRKLLFYIVVVFIRLLLFENLLKRNLNLKKVIKFRKFNYRILQIKIGNIW